MDFGVLPRPEFWPDRGRGEGAHVPSYSAREIPAFRLPEVGLKTLKGGSHAALFQHPLLIGTVSIVVLGPTLIRN